MILKWLRRQLFKIQYNTNQALFGKIGLFSPSILFKINLIDIYNKFWKKSTSVLASTGIYLTQVELIQELLGFLADCFFCVFELERFLSEHNWLHII
jgi:hypothetical protein